ncbi:MAG TPA: M90 family metallopeptidase [Ramlibacter sp.]|jgi:Mlc titration factor MtfA (ptsG expression regulator)|uniref:M90 family metallopeptidase n=1 Tax=Ramlibacter sp. TaxID=1917967 RepID=UPI002D6D5FC6|nr:M90 family metallopeptidase [Ramlibacter sp.]HZY19489.1 M90 family metallopeptidase [Ramlibacter sp.]
MFGWWRKRRPAPQVPDALWHAVLAAYPFLQRARPADEDRLRSLAASFLADKEFHGAQGLAVTDEMALAIAAQAVLPVLHLGLDWYDDFVGIVVHPDQVVARRTTQDEAGVVHEWDEVLAGEAMERGPVMLSWTDVQSAGASAADGYNVVVHEFIHKIDMRDGEADGCPPLPGPRRRAWRATLEAEYERFREEVVIAERFSGEAPWLDPYGAENPGEFFAVAGEAYFVNRPRFARDFPALVALFDAFFAPGLPSR